MTSSQGTSAIKEKTSTVVWGSLQPRYSAGNHYVQLNVNFFPKLKKDAAVIIPVANVMIAADCETKFNLRSKYSTENL